MKRRRFGSTRAKSLAQLGVVALALASALTAALAPGTSTQAATSVAVFVGYADSKRAGVEFPNPWAASPNVTFDGCTPVSACTFDGGALRLENDGSTAIHVDQLTVHLGACVYTWAGSHYPVALSPGASLVATQRASGAAPGCTGPDPALFDSSDIPSPGTCSNDGIVPALDVTIDGVTTSYTDSGQVLNTGGTDPGSCSGANESTQWVRIGSKPCPGLGLTLAPATQTHPVGATARVSATFANACGSPLSGVLVDFKVTAGPNAGATGSAITDPTGTASFTYSSSVQGTDTLQATVTNAVGFTTTSNTVLATWTLEFAPGGGSFVIGNVNAELGARVNFWGSRWAWHNPLSGGSAPRSFKGFADQPAAPACGQHWSAAPGNSTPPPDGPLPGLMAVIVTSSVHQTGSEISGDIVEIVMVKTGSGYEPNPGHAAWGTIVAVVCGSSGGATAASSPSPAPASPSATTPPGSVTAPTSGGGRHHGPPTPPGLKRHS